MKIMKTYWDTVYSWLLIFAPCACVTAGICITFLKALGFYSNVSWSYVYLFDACQILYLILSICFILKIRQKNTDSSFLFSAVKWFITIPLLIQYNFLMHVFITDYIWACTFLYLILIVFLFDAKMLLLNIVAYISSLTLAHLLHAEQHLSSHPEHHLDMLCFRIAVLALCSIFLIAITYFVEKFIWRIQVEDEENQFLIEKQLEHYEHLDIMDKELRKFRHDIQNHFLCMQNLIGNGRQSELQQYFHDLMDTYSKNDNLYFSGNLIVDSILNYNLSHLCKDNVAPVVYGTLPQIDAISSMDLCTVFANMLSNAIKGANASTENKPSLIIRFQHGDKYFSITISNSIAADADKEHSAFHKKDRNHGYGIHKIKEVTEKYQGIFEQGQKDSLFIMEICLPIHQTPSTKETLYD